MDGETTPGDEPNEQQSADEPPVEPTANEQPAEEEPITEPPPRRRHREPAPWEALERLDRQWEDRTPIAQLRQPVEGLALTTDDDPRGWDYIGALTGASPREVAMACEAWLEAQLAADAITLGQSLRPRVDLLPSGRLWFVVRTVFDVIIVIDGPGFMTPVAAAIAASRRYHAELLRVLGRSAEVVVDDDEEDTMEGGEAPDAEASDRRPADGHDGGESEDRE